MPNTTLTTIRDMWATRTFRVVAAVSFLSLVVGVAGIAVPLFPEALSAPVVSLHYNIHFGVDAVGPAWRLFVPSAVAFALTVANMVVAARMWQRERVVAYAYCVTTIVVHVAVLLHVAFIVLLNLTYA